VGEVMACWTYLAFVEEIIIYEQIGLNTTVDNELHNMLEKSLKVAQPQGKPQSNPEAVPAGTKFTDSELVNTISINFVIASNMFAASANQSLRMDVAIMFLQFQMEKMTLLFKIKNLIKKRGWLKNPPFYSAPGLPP
jgi:hypothetical protein